MYYTYIHATPDGDVFYVGKGKGRRVYSMRDRHYLWRRRLEKEGGITMKIVEYFDSEQEAFEAEMQLIEKYKKEGCDLVNLTDGGNGPNGAKQSPETVAKKSKALRGYKHDILTCPHCGTKGGATSIKRWHFDNCSGVRPEYKIRTTVLGKRIYLGKTHTKEEADALASEFFDLVMAEASQMKNVTIPSGSVWTVV